MKKTCSRSNHCVRRKQVTLENTMQLSENTLFNGITKEKVFDYF